MATDTLTRIKRQGLDIDDLNSALGISALDARVTTLESEVIPGADWQQVKSDISNLQTGLSTTNQNVATLTTTSATHTTQIGELQTTVGSHTTSISTLQTDLSGVTGRVETLETSQGQQDTAISNLDSTVSDHTTSISTLNTDVAELKQKIENTDVILGTINLNTGNVTQAALTARANEIISEQGLPALSKGYALYDLDNHEWYYNGTAWVDLGQETVVTIATNTTAGIVRGTTANLGVQYDTNGVGSVNGLATALGNKANQTDMTQAQADIGQLQTDVGTNASAISTLQTDVGDNAAAIETLQTTVGSHTTSIETLNTDVSGLKTTVSSHTTSISNLQTTVGSHTTSISSLQTDVSTNSGNIATLQGDLSNLESTVTTQGQTISSLQTAVDGKQAALTAGDGITLSGANVSLNLAQLLAYLVVAETLTGTPDGSKKAFTLANTPAKILAVERDGQSLYTTEDWSISGTTITFVNAPATGSRLKATYWKA